jgi:hypothetical protein
MKTKIRNKFWNVESESKIPIGLLGQCDYEKKTLHIPHEGDTKDELGTIIHEVLHAVYPDLNEDAIIEGENAITRILWDLKWRKNID